MVKKTKTFIVDDKPMRFKFWKSFPNKYTEKNIREAEEEARKKRKEGYYVRFSGDKESVYKRHAYIKKKR